MKLNILTLGGAVVLNVSLFCGTALADQDFPTGTFTLPHMNYVRNDKTGNYKEIRVPGLYHIMQVKSVMTSDSGKKYFVNVYSSDWATNRGRDCVFSGVFELEKKGRLVLSEAYDALKCGPVTLEISKGYIDFNSGSCTTFCTNNNNFDSPFSASFPYKNKRK